MAAKGEPTGRERGFSAAVRRFPQAEFAIRRLMGQSEAFCDMCDELAEAECALSKIPGAPEGLRETRRLEWQELVDRLVAEVEAALRASEAWQRRQTPI